ncbi:tail protein X [Escherichia coli]|uniref:tail protein X n=1 Tax=Escherichia coli TaxID=562 RepID=UPI0015C4B296|nr:tail protein X [Escherichia coli]NWP54580.1 phage tail protein [Escherichia coli]
MLNLPPATTGGASTTHYGRTEGVVETVLAANPGLAELGAVLPHGTAVELPDVQTAPVAETVNLWE